MILYFWSIGQRQCCSWLTRICLSFKVTRWQSIYAIRQFCKWLKLTILNHSWDIYKQHKNCIYIDFECLMFSILFRLLCHGQKMYVYSIFLNVSRMSPSLYIPYNRTKTTHHLHTHYFTNWDWPDLRTTDPRMVHM